MVEEQRPPLVYQRRHCIKPELGFLKLWLSMMSEPVSYQKGSRVPALTSYVHVLKLAGVLQMFSYPEFLVHWNSEDTRFSMHASNSLKQEIIRYNICEAGCVCSCLYQPYIFSQKML